MPVTIKPSPSKTGTIDTIPACSPESLLKSTSLAWAPAESRTGRGFKHEAETRPILQSSFSGLDQSSTLIPYGNGFVHGAIEVFQRDLHLTLRPDDIWLAILTQLGMFVNTNAEETRRHFVAHKGRKELIMIQNNVVDPGLKDWIIPDFTTTTDNDKSVAAIIMMGTLQKYFTYTVRCGYGLPSVTLLGEKSDWEDNLRRVKKIPAYGLQPSLWTHLLVPVIKRMIKSFDYPDSQEIKDFWLKICHMEGERGSAGGPSKTLPGWITAFCFWTEPEKCLHVFRGPFDEYKDRERLELDDVTYHLLFPSDIPKGVLSVPVTMQDLGTNTQYQTTMIAGSVGMTATRVGRGLDEVNLQPRSGWWVLKEPETSPIDLTPNMRSTRSKRKR